jgi:transposase
MRKVALDLGARKIAYCEMKDGQVIERATVRSLSELIGRLGPNTAPAEVLFEAGRSSWHVHDKLEEWGHRPLMLDTTRARQIGVGQHGRKNDRVDAEALARALESGRVPLAHVLSPHRRELRYQLGVRRALVETRAQYVTTIREVVRAHGLCLRACAADVFVAKLKETSLDERTRELVAPIVVMLEQLDVQIAVANTKVEQVSAQEPVVTLLKTAPGVGPVVAAAFVAVIDQADRFRRAHHVEAYIGLVPGENSTGGARRIGAITKQGNGYLRALLTQAAWAILRGSPDDPLTIWGNEIAKRRGKRIAVVAVARRLVGVLWAMWRRDAVYDPQVFARATAGAHPAPASEIETSPVRLAMRARALKLAAAKGRRSLRPRTTAVSMS